MLKIKTVMDVQKYAISRRYVHKVYNIFCFNTYDYNLEDFKSDNFVKDYKDLELSLDIILDKVIENSFSEQLLEKILEDVTHNDIIYRLAEKYPKIKTSFFNQNCIQLEENLVFDITIICKFEVIYYLRCCEEIGLKFFEKYENNVKKWIIDSDGWIKEFDGELRYIKIVNGRPVLSYDKNFSDMYL